MGINCANFDLPNNQIPKHPFLMEKGEYILNIYRDYKLPILYWSLNETKAAKVFIKQTLPNNLKDERYVRFADKFMKMLEPT